MACSRAVLRLNSGHRFTAMHATWRPMNQSSILLPLLTLDGWTPGILLLIAVQRLNAAKSGKVKFDDFKFDEWSNVPLPANRSTKGASGSAKIAPEETMPGLSSDEQIRDLEKIFVGVANIDRC